MTYLIVALVLACVIGSAIGWEISKNKHPRLQVTYAIACDRLAIEKFRSAGGKAEPVVSIVSDSENPAGGALACR
jgi:hypothetical protein